MILKKLFIGLCLLIGVVGRSTVIIGFAPDFLGETASLYIYNDYLTLTKSKISESKVSFKDSTFTLEYEVKQVLRAIIQIGNTEAEVYLSPDTDYNLFYKKNENTPNAFAIQKASTFFKDLDSTDINYKILQYNNWFDEYLYIHSVDIMKHSMAPYIDTFKTYVYDVYGQDTNGYFINYVRYNLALLERTKVRSKMRKTKYDTYQEYVQPYPVYPYNDQYMSFIGSFYSNDFNSFRTQIKSDIAMAIFNSSPSRLMTAMHRDPFYEKDELRELLMVNMLGNAYYIRQYDRVKIQTMLDSVSRYAKFQENGIAAKNMLKYLTKIETGYPAPSISMVDDAENIISWDKYKGKFIYVNFFATWNNEAVKEMKLMADLYAKYDKYVEFVSFCIDKDSTTYNQFVQENQNLTWPILYLGENHQITKDFNVLTSPYYLLIDQEGFIAQTPAKSPSPDGVYETVDKTFSYIKREMER